MATIRFNAFMFKALSNTGIYGYTQPTILSRQFARTASSNKSNTKSKSASKPKKVTKKDEKLAKLLKQYPDPQQPQRPLNAYLRFSADYKKRKGLQISPDTMGTVSRSVASAWRVLPDDEKSKYTQSYARDKKQYKDAMEKYGNSGRADKWLDKITKLAETKPPKSGYQLFMKKRLPQNRDEAPMTPQPQIMSVKYHYSEISIANISVLCLK